MAENIIYEDTPFAEYLAEIGQEEELVKQPEPAEILRKDSRSEQVSISLIQRFKHDLIEYLNENLSMGLPSLEESSFEELFKYLICTSHLLNDTLSIYFYDTKKPPPLETKDIDIGAYCYGFSRNSFEILLSSIIGLASIFATWLLLLDVHQEGFITKIARLIIPFTFSVLISFMTYLYLRRKSMRTLHRLALHYLKVLVYNCQALDLKINKALIMIQEIELISRGYRLSMPLSPISRIEQHSKNRRCLTLRETIYSILKKAIDSYKDSIKDLQPVVSQNNLTIMYNMYNINSCSENDLEEEYDEVNDEEKDENDKLSLENLKQYFQKMHSKRRECLCHLLALDVMTAGRDSNRRDYEVHWSTINDHLNSLATVLGHYFDKITLALTSEPYTIPTSKQDFMSQSSPMAVSNKKLRSYIHRLASVEQHIRVIQAKLYICNEDARENFDIEGAAGEDEKNKLLNNYESINKDFTYMFQEWEEGMKVLRGMIESTSSDADSSSRRPSLDEDAETLKDETDHEENNYEKHVVDWSQVDGPFDVPEQVFIAEAEPEITKKKMTREERIAIQKTKREEEAKAKAARMDSERMVHELKDVLVRRKPKSSEDELSPQKITTAVEATTTTTTTD